MSGRLSTLAWLWIGLAGCGRTEPTRLGASAVDGSVNAPREISDFSHGYYNSAVGTVLDETQAQFPAADVSKGDPAIRPAAEPQLQAAQKVLGDWLGRHAPPANGHWGAIGGIPSSWAINSETAIVYPIFVETQTRLRGSFGVDNGIFVWVNGVYRFGAVEPGGSNPEEYANIDLGLVPEGLNFVQVLREDHGTGTDYHLKIGP